MDITTIYVWASCMAKATIELARGRCYYSRREAMKHRHAVDNYLYTFKVGKEFIA